jgi:hypothetical protein
MMKVALIRNVASVNWNITKPFLQIVFPPKLKRFRVFAPDCNDFQCRIKLHNKLVRTKRTKYPAQFHIQQIGQNKRLIGKLVEKRQ